MQETILTQQSLQEFYSQVILPQFGIRQRHILWQEHRSIGPDSDIHVFLCDDDQMVLTFDDYPTTTIETLQGEFTGKSITQMTLGDGNVTISGDAPTVVDTAVLHFTPPVPYTYVHNITGYFQLFKLDTPSTDTRIMRLQARRHGISSESAIYNSLVDIGFEIIALAKDEGNHSHVIHLAHEAQDIARQHGFRELSDLLFDIGEGIDWYDTEPETSWQDYLTRQKKILQSLTDASHVNPGVTGTDKDLLEQHTLPILSKMVQQPDKSPEYFLELAHTLDALIRDQDLNMYAAAQELSYTLDRPQIASSAQLRPAVIKAYELQMPKTLRQDDSMGQWDEFYKEITKISHQHKEL